jgi:hypothetical protein
MVPFLCNQLSRNKLQNCLHGATLTNVVAVVAKSRSEFDFPQMIAATCLAKDFGLHGRLDGEMFMQLVSQRHCETSCRENYTFIRTL